MKNTFLTLRILYPVWMIIGMFALMYIPSVFVVSENPLATTENIKNNELLFRVGILASIITQLLYIVIPILLYKVFRQTDATQAMLMLAFSLVAAPIALFGSIYDLQILSTLDQSEIVMSHFNFKRYSLTMATIFWGLWLFPLGKLAIKSKYFPILIGYFLYAGGVGYLLSAAVKIVFPNYEMIFNISEILTIGEVIFILWFVIKGPNLLNETTEN
ncbi:DUF4386 domain-containing protein [Tenacibaculum sp. 190524A05c]|uniref:DUF4386 domain-containing protein n=1 Tax=Tenacibaculum platacis TaxID=3137852 RepID=UPI0032B1CCDC